MKNITKLIVENDILVKRCVEKGIGLTVGQEYQILAEGNYWYMVKDDNGLTVHFAKEHFAGGKQYNGFLSNEKPNARRELFNILFIFSNIVIFCSIISLLAFQFFSH